ncbi:hypothetical protein CYLTODRAFT_492478 [Cylindrobasidium torrendii FP15055 ss-10]|uniref:Uncharacterized protein n=1 Tax=Cylindrobasidium torrendii FP15055 ss-10 TaxID=1314674 RepID=A0A0D7B3V4_9AGAR|nr:hypothetical protein CYLTODRAFT_492478 [Cylindrobasidium torrendii FP15055 ss-10]
MPAIQSDDVVTRRLRRSTRVVSHPYLPGSHPAAHSVPPQLAAGDPDLDAGYRHLQVFAPIPQHEAVDDSAVEDINNWFDAGRGLPLIIPGWKLKTELPIVRQYRKFVRNATKVSALDFELQYNLEEPTILSRRLLHAHLHSAYDMITPYIPKIPHQELTTVLQKHNGERLLSRLAAIGVVDIHRFAILAGLCHQQNDSYVPLLLLALGVRSESESSSALITLMQRWVIRTTEALKHESVIARIIFYGQLFTTVRRILWHRELVSPMPRIIVELLDPRAYQFEGLVARVMDTTAAAGAA